MESTYTENTQIQRWALMDHKIIIEGLEYNEKKELERHSIYNRTVSSWRLLSILQIQLS